jgi:hypothetical protein
VTFHDARERLSEREGRRVTDFHVGVLVEASRRRIVRYNRAPPVPPAVTLAVLLAARLGLDGANDLAGYDDVEPRRFDELARGLPLEPYQVAALLGLSAKSLASMRRGYCGRAPDGTPRPRIIRRVYLLAMLELTARFGPGSDLASALRAGQAWAAREKARAPRATRREGGRRPAAAPGREA